MKNLEGLLLVEAENSSPEDALIAINAKRPIQRQRYSCAHELCHLIKDIGQYDPYFCIAGSKSRTERFAENFAACFLMPRREVCRQVSKYHKTRFLECDDILRISYYFGTSFQACLYLIGECCPYALPLSYKEVFGKFKPASRKNELNLDDTVLYTQLLNNWPMMWSGQANKNASFAFKADYVFNDARLEGVDVAKEAAAEIIADIRTNNGKICSKYSSFLEIAGHSSLYDMIFADYNGSHADIYIITKMNRILFSYIAYPEFGGRTRTQNTLVLNSKFETADYREVMKKLGSLNEEVKILEASSDKMLKSEILYRILEIHHELTVIHPFSDGNGRTARAFMNFQLLRYGFPPVFISLSEKADYIKALTEAEKTGNVDMLYALIIPFLVRNHANLFSLN